MVRKEFYVLRRIHKHTQHFSAVINSTIQPIPTRSNLLHPTTSRKHLVLHNIFNNLQNVAT